MTVVEAYVNHKKDVINRNNPSSTLNEEENGYFQYLFSARMQN